MSDKLPCCGNDKVILVDISRDDYRQIQCSECGAKFWQDKKTGELSHKNFEPKRPWTSGKWVLVGLPMYVDEVDISDHEMKSNRKLASKAPDMAENVLIKLAERLGYIESIDDIGCITEIALAAVKLLKEIGYDPEGE